LGATREILELMWAAD